MGEKQYHVVRCNDPKRAAQIIMPCPAEMRETEGNPNQGPVRAFGALHLGCSNFKGSAHLPDMIKAGKDQWETLEEGVEVGMVEGLEL